MLVGDGSMHAGNSPCCRLVRARTHAHGRACVYAYPRQDLRAMAAGAVSEVWMRSTSDYSLALRHSIFGHRGAEGGEE